MSQDFKGKKISLGELPDEGVLIQRPASLEKVKFNSDPSKARIHGLHDLDHEARLQEMSRRWRYDAPTWNSGWAIFLASVMVVQYLDIYSRLHAEEVRMDETLLGLAGPFLKLITLGLHNLLRYPMVFALLTPFLFRFRQPSPYYLELGFSGVDTVKSFTHRSPTPARVLLKWDEIARVETATFRGREILVFFSSDQRIGEAFWALSEHQKKSVHIITRQFIGEDHPFARFLQSSIKFRASSS